MSSEEGKRGERKRGCMDKEMEDGGEKSYLSYSF